MPRSAQRPIIRIALNKSELAIAISVSIGSVEAMVSEGALPRPRLWHRRKVWLVSEVEAYLARWPTDEPDDEVDTWSDVVPPRQIEVPVVLDEHAGWEKHYAAIGFDPKTMDPSELPRLRLEAEARWRASMPGTPLNKRETTVLFQLKRWQARDFIKFNELKWMGIDTAERLEARGFVEIRYRGKDRVEGYVLTEAGGAAAREIDAPQMPL